MLVISNDDVLAIDWSGFIPPEILSQFPNIVYISSNIFRQNIIFPLLICLEIRTLEILHFKRNTRFSVKELLKVVGKLPKIPKEFLTHPCGDICRARCTFDIRVKRSSWDYGNLVTGPLRCRKIYSR